MSTVSQIPVSTFSYDLGEGTEWTLSKFTDGAKVTRVADVQEARATIQKDLNRPEKDSNRNSVELKGKVLHLGKNNPKYQHMLGATQPQNNFAGEILKVLVNTKLNMSLTFSHMSMYSKIG